MQITPDVARRLRLRRDRDRPQRRSTTTPIVDGRRLIVDTRNAMKRRAPARVPARRARRRPWRLRASARPRGTGGVMEAVFWASFGLVHLRLRGVSAACSPCGRGCARRERQTRRRSYLPPVSIVIAVRNEAPRLPGRIENLLALDYPAELLEIIVVSDGSTDATARSARGGDVSGSSARRRRLRAFGSSRWPGTARPRR